MNEQDKPTLFDMDKSWQEEWKNMPEFVQRKKEAYAEIVFRFDNAKDLQDFANLIGQKLTKNTKSAWYPPLVRGADIVKRWVSES
jgi:hypothetical protein